jgi:hypothetical protein
MPFPNAIPERESYILQQVLAGNYEADWNPIDSVIDGHTARFWVMTDALKVDGVRVCVSAELQQQIADRIGASLLTPKLADLLHAQAEVVLGPLPRSITSSTQAMLEQDAAITKAIETATGVPDGAKGVIVSTVGKYWCLDKQLETKPNKAVNYGWHFQGTTYKGIKGYPTASGEPKGTYVIQQPSTAHNAQHVDYSQVCVLVLKACLLDGQISSLADVLTNPDLAKLASATGPLKVLRQPGVPEPADKSVILPEVVITPDAAPFPNA